LGKAFLENGGREEPAAVRAFTECNTDRKGTEYYFRSIEIGEEGLGKEREEKNTRSECCTPKKKKGGGGALK